MKKIHYKEVESMKNHHDDTISLSIKTKLNLLQKIENMSRKSFGSNKKSKKTNKICEQCSAITELVLNRFE